MNSMNLLSTHLRDKRIPQYHICHFINEEHNNKHSRLPHIHDDFLELFFVYSGEGRYLVDSKAYDIKEGDLVICNAGILHGESPEDTRHVRSYSVGISNVAFLGLPDNQLCDEETNPVLTCGMLSKQIGEIFRLIYLLSSDTKNLKETCNTLSISLLLLTYEMILSRDRNAAIHTRSSASATAYRVRRYLDTHYREALTLSDISKALHINEYYLAHAFKDEFDLPPIQYVMKRRIGEAQGLLMDTSISIGDIADYLGFSSVSHLNTMFNKYVGIPPGKYRQSIKNMEE